MSQSSPKARKPQLRRSLCATAMAISMLAYVPAGYSNDEHDGDGHRTASPIKHVIVIVGENRSFDHLFATYVPKSKKEKVLNLLSEGIIKADGSPGPNFATSRTLVVKSGGRVSDS